MTRRALAAVALAAACACSGKTETGDESACEKIVQQICAKWIQDMGPDSGKEPCDPPATSPTDFTVACKKADEKCSAPAASIACPSP
ncbi:MAG: hypothetical protein HS104_23275 [Polyangiaceae bacterium]|nr:hypothetical protein [Polyangiaceae bacterium]